MSRPSRRTASLLLASLLVAGGLAGCLFGRGKPAALTEVQAPPRLTPKRRDPRDGRSWVVMYSPHPDDETIGTGQAIRRFVTAGYNVQVVLLTDGETSHSFEGYYRKHPELWADLDGNGVMGDRGDFGLERRREFTRATASLGVPPRHLAFYGVGGGTDGLTKDFIPTSRILEIMRRYERAHPGALHVTVMKYTDGAAHGAGDAKPQGEHRAACDALLTLARTGKVRAEFYKIYVYGLPLSQRWSPAIEYDPDSHVVKRRALLNGYDDADQRGHLAIGWHSVPVVIDDVLSDPNEYRVPATDALAAR